MIKKRRGPYKGKLDLPGVRPEYGETIKETLKREVLEEIGITVYSLRLFDNYATVVISNIDSYTEDQLYHIGVSI